MFFVRTKDQSNSKIDQKERKSNIVCAVCLTPISNKQSLIVVDGQTPFHTFYNPNQVRFDIMTLLQCQSIQVVSPAFLEDTWFPNYHWRIIVCQKCQEHLGWQFESTVRTPSPFFGIIQNKVLEMDDG